MVWCCQPVAAAICSTVAPSGRLSISIISACLVPARGVGFAVGSPPALPRARWSAARPWPWPCALAGLLLAGVAAPSASVAGAGASAALSASADVGAVSGAGVGLVAGRSSPSGSTPIAAMPSLVMTTRSGPPSPPRTRIRPRLRRLPITLLRAPPLSVEAVGQRQDREVGALRGGAEDHELGVAELGHGMISVGGEHHRPPTTPSPGGRSRAGRVREIGAATRRARPR